jgi:transglutaminase-like putative cysteine protease
VTPPRFLLGACLLFWGWQAGFPEAAVAMAAAVEAAPWVGRRWDLGLTDFNRVSDVCTTLFIGMVLWLLATVAPTRVVFIALQWLPMAYFPLILVQTYSTSPGVDLRALSLIFRKGNKAADRSRVIDLSYPYAILCVLSAGAANLRHPAYYLGVLLLTAFGLTASRSRRFSLPVWGMVLLLAGGVGWLGQAGLHRLQGIIEEKGMEWFAVNGETDPFRTVTAIGELGELKPSDRIRFRVRGPEPGGEPLLLMESSYNSYRFFRWYAVKSRFAPLRPVSGGDWSLAPAKGPARSATVISPLRDGEGLLPLPPGTFRISNLPVAHASANPYGAVRVTGGPGLVDYTARYHPAVSRSSPPDANDRVVPGPLAESLYGLVRAEGIAGESPPAAVDAVTRFFREGFSYSLSPTLGDGVSMDLTGFLLGRRAGHCEYFATATVLLLRAAGVPARYAVGYSVQEYSRLEEAFLVRDRHAHSWALAWIDGTWRPVDTTPPDWSRLEAAAAGSTLIGDFWAWLRFKISWLRYREEARKHLVWLLIPLTLVLIRRFYRERGGRRKVRPAEKRRSGPDRRPGADSPFYRIEAHLAQRWFPREAGEPLSRWLHRLARQGEDPPDPDRLAPLLALHYRARFHGDTFTTHEEAALSAGVEAWLREAGQGQPSR